MIFIANWYPRLRITLEAQDRLIKTKKIDQTKAAVRSGFFRSQLVVSV
jgi:hypothetical protein